MNKVFQDTDGLRDALENARELVARAIAILDQAGANADIAAHLDFALHRMGGSY